MNFFLAKGARGVRDEGRGVFKAVAVLFRVESGQFDGRFSHLKQEIRLRVVYHRKPDVKKAISNLGDGLFHVKNTLYGNEISISLLKMTLSYVKMGNFKMKKSLFQKRNTFSHNKKIVFYIEKKLFHMKNTVFNNRKGIF